MDIAANLSSTQNSIFAENEDNDEDVWGMPKYQQNYSLENLTDEQYLARVCVHSSSIRGLCLMKSSSETIQNLPHFIYLYENPKWFSYG